MKQVFLRKAKGGHIAGWLIIIILALATAGIFYYAFNSGSGLQNDEEKTNEESWLTYRNEDFGFELKYPPQWTVAQTFSADTPAFNVYKKDETQDPPFYHSNLVTQVSIFPRGVPTEGAFGSSLNSNVVFNTDVLEARDFILEDGTRWATFASIKNSPASWNESGFIWNSVEIKNLKISCFRAGEPIAKIACEPFLGDTLIRSGTINKEDRKIAEKILSSFTLTGTGDNAKSDSIKDLIRLDSPKVGATIKSPLQVEGRARGTWYFEASFPIVLVDWDGKIIAESHAEAQSDWMTQDFVPFSGVIEFSSPVEGQSDAPDFMKRGTLILKKDNPSGLPENDAALEIPVVFK